MKTTGEELNFTTLLQLNWQYIKRCNRNWECKMYFSYFSTWAAVSCGYFAWDLEAECYFAATSLIREVENVLVTKKLVPSG